MSRRKFPRNTASKFPKRFVIPSPGSLSRMSQRKLARRCVTVPKLTPTATQAHMKNRLTIHSQATELQITNPQLQVLTKLRKATVALHKAPTTKLLLQVIVLQMTMVLQLLQHPATALKLQISLVINDLYLKGIITNISLSVIRINYNISLSVISINNYIYQSVLNHLI